MTVVYTMPRIDKRKMAGKAVVVSSDESQDDDSESSEQFSDGLSDESENDKYVDSSDEDKMDKVLFKLYRQQIVKKMKMKLINSSSHVVRKRKDKKAKGTVKSDGSFSRFSAKYFSEVVSSLSPHQRSIVDKYGFKNLLLFDSHSVPKKFAAWIVPGLLVRLI